MIKKRVSEIITIEETRNWSNNDIITITAGTGVGKSYYIKNILYLVAKEQNKKILFLIHRTNCRDQFLNEIIKDNKQDIIHLMTYQYLESYYLKNNSMIDLSEYSYIVCDEFHYFISDAAFNKTTDISLNTILKQNCIRIFMSATADIVKRYLNNIKKYKTIDYEIEINFDFINKLCFYNKENSIETIIKEIIDSKAKGIIFINNVEKAYKLYNKFKDNAIFNCSKNNNKYYKYVDKELINDILKNEKFNSNVLVTTSCFDAGINIIDDDLKHIVVHGFFDIDIIKQMIGRKRLQKDSDKINIFIKSYTNNQIAGYKTKLNKKVEKAEYFIDNGISAYIYRYFKDSDKTEIIYDTLDTEGKPTKELNQLMYFKAKKDIFTLAYMLEKGVGYNNYIAEELKVDKDNIIIFEEDTKKMELDEYLKTLIGINLFKEQQKELINKIGLKDARGRMQKSISLLNRYLIDNYKMTLKSDRETIEGKKYTIWILSNV